MTKQANIKKNNKKAPFRVKEGRWENAKDLANAAKREKVKKISHGNKTYCAEDDYSDAALRQYCL